MTIQDSIGEWKRRRQALIVAHNYTIPEVQDIADFVGDSLELSIKARGCPAPVLVFCGVRFMAETAKILSPETVVLHPNPHSGCPMADMADVEAVRQYRQDHPDTVLVAYVNTTAAVKTAVDICCTSGNAAAVIGSIPPERKIMFLPDANLGRNLVNSLGRPMEVWPGFCPTHNRIWPEAVRQARQAHPEALVLVHPECLPQVVAEADQALSTGGMLRFARESTAASFIIGTETGLLHRLRRESPGKAFYPLEPEPVCPNMKKITLEHVLFALQKMEPRVELPATVISAARLPIERMLAVTA